MKPAAIGAADEGEPIKRAALVKFQPDDLFPNLGGLVPAHLGVLQIIREGCRLLSQHFKSFLLPIGFLTLAMILRFQGGMSHQDAVSGMLTAISKQSSDSPWKDPPVPQGLRLLYIIVRMVLIICSEVGFHQAVVAAYLKERRGKDDVPDQDGISAFLVAASRCAWSYCAYLILVFEIGLVLIGVHFFFRRSLLDFELTIGLAVVIVLVVGPFFIVIFPVSALTTASGFQALKRSFLMTRGHFKCCIGLYLTFILVSLVVMWPVVVAIMHQPLTVSTLFLLGITIVGEWIINVIWAPCRAVLYLKFRAWPESDESIDVLLDP